MGGGIESYDKLREEKIVDEFFPALEFLLVKQTELGNASIKDRLENKRRLLVELNSELLKKIGDFNPKIFEEENINKQTDALLETAGEASTRGFKLGHFTSKAWD